MNKTIPDKPFDDEQAARNYAIAASGSSIMYIILTAGQYFVSASKSVQPYEKLVASYVHGKLC